MSKNFFFFRRISPFGIAPVKKHIWMKEKVYLHKIKTKTKTKQIRLRSSNKWQLGQHKVINNNQQCQETSTTSLQVVKFHTHFQQWLAVMELPATEAEGMSTVFLAWTYLPWTLNKLSHPVQCFRFQVSICVRSNLPNNLKKPSLKWSTLRSLAFLRSRRHSHKVKSSD